MTRAEPGSKWRKSRASDCREISASAPASSTPVGPPPTTTNVSSALRAGRIGLALGVLEREQHAAADLQRILERLQSGRERAPLVVAEVGVGRAGGENQVVVGHLAVGQDHAAPGDVDAARLPRAALRRWPGAAGSTGSARRCRRARAPRSPPGTAAAGRRGDSGGRAG